MTSQIPVIAAPHFDAGLGRIEITMDAGSSIEQIIMAALPGLTVADRIHCRVALVSDRGSIIVPSSHWARVYPHAGVRVVIRVIPGKDALKSILQIVVSIAAIALGQFWATPALAASFGISTQALAGIIGLGINVIGNLLINALIPPAKPDEKAQNRYSISGFRNRLEPNAAVPLVLGTMRYAPPFGVYSYTEIVGDLIYIRMVVCPGYGPLSSTGFHIGDTDLSEYDEVDIEVRDGRPDDEPLSLVTKQIVEETIGAELLMPYPRDDLGEIVSGSEPEEEPVVRTTGADASGVSVILAWPAGLVRYDSKGRQKTHTVTVRIEQRRIDATDWTLVETIVVTARKLEAFYRQHSWTFATRGRWQVRCVMMTPETTDAQVQQRTSWAALQTIRPEYPFNFPHPLALVALRIKATHQINGTLDNFSGVFSRQCLDYDHVTETWIERETSSPASLYRYVLQSPANPKPVADAGIDLPALAEWHDMCRLKGLKYDSVIEDSGTTLRDLLTEIAAAGRASPRHDGIKWSVTIDRPDKLAIDHFNPRNSYDLRSSRSYVEPPDGFRVKFLDASNDYKSAERLVPWPGNEEGDIVLTEELELPGKTDAAEIYRETRRRMYEAIYRPDIHTLSLDGPISAATRGDRVRVSSDVLDRVQLATRVKAVEGRLIEIDEPATMVDGKSYAVRFITGLTAEDTIGTSIIRTLVHRAGSHLTVVVTGDGAMPVAGDILHFGEASNIDYDLVITGSEAGEDFSQHLRLVDRAAIIDEIIDAEEIPEWSGRVGAEIDTTALMPPAPRFTSIVSGVAETDASGRIEYLIQPGTGSVATASYEIEHRVSGGGAYTMDPLSTAASGGEITAYANGTVVDMRARALTIDGTPGTYTTVITFTVGSGDLDLPEALEDAAITVGALLGGAVVQFSSGPDAVATQVQIYRSTSAILDRETDASGAPIAILPSRSYSVPVGDTTRENLLINGAMDAPGTWTGTDWTITGGKAVHTPGTGSSLAQPLVATAGVYYRVSFDLSDLTAGTLTPRLTGGSNRPGTARSVNGAYTDRIQAVTGNDTFGLLPSAAFDGKADNVIVYVETPTCLPQGINYFWLEPQNDDGVPGPVSGPFSLTIR